MFLLTAALLFLFLVVFLVYHVILYRNPYKLYMVFGKKGSGKTTLMCKLALKYAKAGRPVYCNTPIPGTYYFDADRIGFGGFPEESVILIDEVGMIWDNRNFKSFKTEVRDYFKLQRHYKHTVYLFSQTFDVDKKLRDLTDNMYLIHNFFNCFTIARRITKTITIVHAGQGSESTANLADDMQFDSLLLFFLGTVKITYIPKYARYFDSFDVPELPEIECRYIPFPEHTKKARGLPGTWVPAALRRSYRQKSEDQEGGEDDDT
ncbi:ATP-binding protein [Lachnoclostridium sp. An14]|uniref:ATP-binding protein n=1 Tax=Lachnoclostridium sp. An14 TaxID=1965562 RepID=UPI001FA88BA5|nr:ATP-binding protein [Lachnoclostridium sp. An14]